VVVFTQNDEYTMTKKLETFNLNNKRKNKRSNCKRHVDLVGQRPVLRQKN